MRDYENIAFKEIVEQVKNRNETTLNVEVINVDFIFLQYFLTRNFYYAVIIDDYPFEIIDKESLLEALYFQARLITMNNLNWDAFEEALNDASNNFLEFEGICLLFKNGSSLINKLPNEFKMLAEIIQEINKQHEQNQIKIVLNNSAL